MEPETEKVAKVIHGHKDGKLSRLKASGFSSGSLKIDGSSICKCSPCIHGTCSGASKTAAVPREIPEGCFHCGISDRE